MPYNIFDTHYLLASVREMTPVTTFLLDRYFPTNAATDIFKTNDVLVEYKKGNKKVSPFVHPRKDGVAIKRDGYQMKRFTPGHIAPKRTLTVDDLEKRGFGEALYSNLTPDQRQGAITMGDLDELRQMNTRRKEAMAAEVLFTNGLVMNEYVDDLGKTEEREVRFYDSTNNPAVFTPSKNWDTTQAGGVQMEADMAAMIQFLTKRGLPASDLLVAPDVADVMLNNEMILKKLDIRRVEIGGINPEMLPAGVAKIMRLNIKGRMIDVLCYEEEYEDVDGTIKPYIPAGHICLTAPNCGRTLYGSITQMEESDKQFHTYAGENIPKYIADAAHDIRQVRLASAPLCMPNNENPFISAKVL